MLQREGAPEAAASHHQGPKRGEPPSYGSWNADATPADAVPLARHPHMRMRHVANGLRLHLLGERTPSDAADVARAARAAVNERTEARVCSTSASCVFGAAKRTQGARLAVCRRFPAELGLA